VKWWNNLFLHLGLEKVTQETGFASDWNAFYAGAKKTAWGDVHSALNLSDASVKFSDFPDGVAILLESPAPPRDLKAPIINRDFADSFALTGQGLEDPQGRPISLDHDLLGKQRQLPHRIPGPLETVPVNPHLIKVLAGPQSVNSPIIRW
jgi:hypothetical protein